MPPPNRSIIKHKKRSGRKFYIFAIVDSGHKNFISIPRNTLRKPISDSQIMKQLELALKKGPKIVQKWILTKDS